MLIIKIIRPATGKVSGTLTNFPALINPTVMTGWGTITLAEAQSLRFYTSSARTTELPREVVSATEIYVLVPTLTETTEIYCDYDGIRADYATTDTYGRNAVWSGYRAVYHLDSLVDSSGNGYDLTNNNTVTMNASGQIGGSADFTSGNTNKSLHVASQLGISNTYTITSWVYKYDLTIYNQGPWVFNNNSNITRQYSFYENLSGDYMSFSHERNNLNLARISSLINWSNETWHKMTQTYDNTLMKVYLDGVLKNESNIVGNGTGSLTSALRIGSHQSGSAVASFFWQGRVDEMRVSTSVYSNDWEVTENNNQSDISTFWAETTTTFTNPANIYASDDTYTTITTAETTVSVSVSQDAGVTFSSELSQTLTSSDTVVSFGTTPASETWGLNWTRADLVDSLFRVKITVGGFQQIYKDFGFTTGTEVVYGIEIKLEGKATGGTVSLDKLEVKIHYGNTLLPIKNGSQIYVSDGRKAGEGVGAGTGVLAFYDGTNWIAVDTGLTVDD